MEQNLYQLKREDKEKTLHQEHKKRKLKKLSRYAVILLILLLGIFGLYKLVSRPSVPISGEFYEAQSREHIQVGALHQDYNSNPPTGGWHYEQSVQSGIYDKELKDEQILHNLEHGHIWIAYKPDLPKEQVDALANIALSYGSKIVMEPRSANDSMIAIVAWERLLKLDSVDEVQIKAFIDATRGRGPENVPDSGFKDFR